MRKHENKIKLGALRFRLTLHKKNNVQKTFLILLKAYSKNVSKEIIKIIKRISKYTSHPYFKNDTTQKTDFRIIIMNELGEHYPSRSIKSEPI